MTKPLFDLVGLTPLQLAAFNKSAGKLFKFDGVVKCLLAQLETMGATSKETINGLIDYNRHTFNRLDHKGQAAYMARLHARRIYVINAPDHGTCVPKNMFDRCTLPDTSRI